MDRRRLSLTAAAADGRNPIGILFYEPIWEDPLGIAITEPHRELEHVANHFLSIVDARRCGRALLESNTDAMPPFWDQVVTLGWLGLHLHEDVGGSGFSLEELLIVVEAMGRAVAPGPFVPTVIASAVIAATGTIGQQKQWLPDLAQGRRNGAFGFGERVTVVEGRATGPAGVLLGGSLAQVLVLVSGNDVIVLDRGSVGVEVVELDNVDRSRRSVLLSLDNTPVDVLSRAAGQARSVARTILAAEAAGGARECCDAAAAYARERLQFGRPIGVFQAVKHHCANMLVSAEMAVAAVWDAGIASRSGDADQFDLSSAVAAHLAPSAFLTNSHLMTQVHGGNWLHLGA